MRFYTYRSCSSPGDGRGAERHGTTRLRAARAQWAHHAARTKKARAVPPTPADTVTKGAARAHGDGDTEVTGSSCPPENDHTRNSHRTFSSLLLYQHLVTAL